MLMMMVGSRDYGGLMREEQPWVLGEGGEGDYDEEMMIKMVMVVARR